MTTLPLPSNVFQLGAVVTNPAVAQNPDNQLTPIGMGRHGEMLMSEVHPFGYIAASRGNSFVGSSGAAGISAIAAPASTTGSFVVFNPVGSGVLVSIDALSFTNPTSTQTQIIAGLSLEGSLQTPTGTLTQGTITSYPMGAARGQPVAKVYTAGPTIVAMTYICGLGLNITATTGMSSPAVREFNGRMLLAPGFAVNVCSTLVQTAEHLGVDVFWTEWLM